LIAVGEASNPSRSLVQLHTRKTTNMIWQHASNLSEVLELRNKVQRFRGLGKNGYLDRAKA
jgi:hypothetical protein